MAATTTGKMPDAGHISYTLSSKLTEMRIDDVYGPEDDMG